MKSPIIHRDLSRAELENHSVDNLVALALVQNEEARLAIEEHNESMDSFNKLAKIIGKSRVEADRVYYNTIKLRNTTIQHLKNDLNFTNKMVEAKIEQKQELYSKLDEALKNLKSLRVEVGKLKEPACYDRLEILEIRLADADESVTRVTDKLVTCRKTIRRQGAKIDELTNELQSKDKTIEENEVIIESITDKLNDFRSCHSNGSFEDMFLLVSKKLQEANEIIEDDKLIIVSITKKLEDRTSLSSWEKLTKELNAANHKYQISDAYNSSLQSELDQVRNKLETCEACNVVVHDELNTLRSDLKIEKSNHANTKRRFKEYSDAGDIMSKRLDSIRKLIIPPVV